MDHTFFSWKSHTRSGSTNGANMPPDAPSTWMRIGSFGCSWLYASTSSSSFCTSSNLPV